MDSTQRKLVSFAFFALLLALSVHSLEADIELPGCPTRPDGTTSWPELVGKTGCEAAHFIKEENSEFDPIVLPYDSAVTLDYICNRVRIPIKGQFGLVEYVPHIG